MTTSSRVSATAIAIVTLLAFTLDSLGEQHFPVGSPIYRKGALSDAVFGEALAIGDFDGDGERDAVVLDGQHPALMLRPEVFGTAIHAAIDSSDFALLPDSTDDRDSIVSVGPSGLSRIRFDSTTGAFVATSIPISAFVGATRITVGQFDGIGGFDVAAVTSSGTIVTALSAGSTFIAGPAFSGAGIAKGVDALDTDGDGTDELSLLLSTGLALHEPTGSLIYGYSWVVPSMIATVISSPLAAGGTHESLVVLATLNSGTQLLRTFSFYGNSALTNLGSLGAVSMAAGDRDGDGDSDLVLSIRTAAGFAALENTAATYGIPTFTLPSSIVTFENPARNPSLNSSGIGLADFDHDGDLDTLALAQGNQHLGGQIFSNFQVVRNQSIAHESLKPTVSGASYHFPAEPFVESNGEPNPAPNGTPHHIPSEDLVGEASFHLELTTPTQLLSVPGGTTKFQFSVWRNTSLFNPELGTQSTPFVDWTAIAIQPGGTEISFDLPEDFLISGAAFGVVVRQVVVNQSGQIIARAPSETIVVGSQEDYELAPRLHGTKYAENPELVLGNGHEGEIDDGALGSVVVGPRVPDYDPETRPSGSGS